MQLNRFGSTDLHVSPLTIGAWQLGGPVTFDGQPDGHPDPGAENVHAMIRALGDLGINAIDTAEQYGGGESERRVGRAIAPDRDRWVVSTKFGYRVGPGGQRDDGSQPHTIAPSIEGSLKRLNTDRIDLLLYHCAPDPADLPEAKRVLEDAQRAGKVRYFGISTPNAELTGALAGRGLLHGLQVPHSLLNPAEAAIAAAHTAGAGVQVRGVMAGGKLSGRYFKQAPTLHADDHRRKGDDDYTRYAAMEAALPAEHTAAQAAVKWALADPRCHTVCLGAKSLDDYRAIIDGFALPPLTDADLDRLNGAAAALGSA